MPRSDCGVRTWPDIGQASPALLRPVQAHLSDASWAVSALRLRRMGDGFVPSGSWLLPKGRASVESHVRRRALLVPATTASTSLSLQKGLHNHVRRCSHIHVQQQKHG